MLVASGRSAFVDINGTDAYKIPFSQAFQPRQQAVDRIERAVLKAALVRKRRQRWL
jgi:hypothetical protein